MVDCFSYINAGKFQFMTLWTNPNISSNTTQRCCTTILERHDKWNLLLPECSWRNVVICNGYVVDAFSIAINNTLNVEYSLSKLGIIPRLSSIIGVAKKYVPRLLRRKPLILRKKIGECATDKWHRC